MEDKTIIATRSFSGDNKKKQEFQVDYCSNIKGCEVYKKGMCLRSTLNLFSYMKCKYSTTSTFTGYTKKALKYDEFFREKEKKYGKVISPLAVTDGVYEIGEYIILTTIFLPKEDNLKNTHWEITLSDDYAWIKKENFDISLIKKIILYKPRAFFGGEIKSYQEEFVPMFIKELRKKFKNLYDQLSIDEKELEKSLNLIGKRVYITTLSKGAIIKNSYGTFLWDGKYLTDKDYKPSMISLFSKGEYTCELKIKATGAEITKITEEMLDYINDDTKIF